MPAEMRWILSTLLAGIVTPALAMVFYLIGSSFYEGDLLYLTFFSIWTTMLSAAIIFGAPFAIPVFLTVRLRNAWGALPFIAIAAGSGIELQFALSRLIGSDAVSVILMLIWIIPAIFGTVAAMALKWRQRTSSFTIASLAMAALTVFIFVGANRARELGHAYLGAATWSQLRVGIIVFTGGADTVSGQTVCPSLADIYVEPRADQCRVIAPGTPAIVDAIIPCSETNLGSADASARVRLHAADGSWSGFADAELLQPSIPVGTVIELDRDWAAPLGMDDDSGAQTTIGDEALVKVLRYDPRRDASLYVKIIDGTHRGQTGWTSLGFADPGSVAFGDYGLVYPYVC
jgi:hypothetical protein